MADEIQSGLGRTGKLFAYMHEGVTPDVLIVGKALAGGFYPVSAVLASREILGVFTARRPRQHLRRQPARLRRCPDRPARADGREDGRALRGTRSLLPRPAQAIQSPAIKEVRGKGMWIGIELTGKARPYCEALKEEGILCKETHDHVIRIAPPLVITREEIDWAVERIERVLGKKA